MTATMRSWRQDWRYPAALACVLVFIALIVLATTLALELREVRRDLNCERAQQATYQGSFGDSWDAFADWLVAELQTPGIDAIEERRALAEARDAFALALAERRSLDGC